MSSYEDGFYDVTRIVDGALDDDTLCANDTELDAYIYATRKAFATYGASPGLVEVYALWHGHPTDIGDAECFCAQYVTSNAPRFTLTPEDRKHLCQCLTPGCEYVWDDREEPTPAARCPREYDHPDYDEYDEGDEVPAGVRSASVPFAGDWPAEVAAAIGQSGVS